MRRAGSSHEELSAAQRAAVNADAHLVVVQGGPGTGKTEAALARIARLTTSLRQDAVWLLALVTSDAKVRPFRQRLARSLAAAGCAESVVERTAACVVSATALGAGAAARDAEVPLPVSAWPVETVRRVSAVALQLTAALGLARHPEEARDLLLETMRLVSRGGEPHDGAGGGGDWLRRGVALVEESVRFAQVESLRHLRMLEGEPGWIGDLGRQLRRAGDVAQRSRDLRSAVDRAMRTAASGRADLERLRGLVDVAGIDLTEAARREAVAALARRRLWETAEALVRELGAAAQARADDAWASGSSDLALVGGVRHVVVDDAHDLSSGEMVRLRRMLSPASLFVTGDQRAAAWRSGSDAQFRSLLREAGRAVVLLEAPRFGAGVGRFINALGSRLWPASEPGGYAPAIARLESDPSAAAPVELWLVRRRAHARPDGGEHPEPIADARRREAAALAAGVRWTHGAGRDGDAAVLVQGEAARGPVTAALEAEGVSALADVRTVEECQGLEWSTVFVAGLDEPLGGPAPRRAWVDSASGLAVVWPEDDGGRRVWPFSSLLLAQRAAAARDALARRRLFLAAARARTRLVLAGVTRKRAAGGGSCVAPVEWLRRELGIPDLADAPLTCRMGEASVGVRVVDAEQFPAT
ncbi:MAG: hypothetical protein ABSG61_03680 [Gemmatimonadales bacterium]|jgi:hypothetical protein